MKSVVRRGSSMKSTIPQCKEESNEDYAMRMECAGLVSCLVLPRSKDETSEMFEQRMVEQANSKRQTVLPKSKEPKLEKKQSAEPAQLTKSQSSVEEVSEAVPKKSAYKVNAEAYAVDAAAITEKVKEWKQRAAERPKPVYQPPAEPKAAEPEEAPEPTGAEEPVLSEEEVKAAEARAAAEAKAKEEARKIQAQVEAKMAARKVEEEARRRAEEELARQPAWMKEPPRTVNLATIGFMPLKKLMAERGVPQQALFSCANKAALKELAAKHPCKLLFSEEQDAPSEAPASASAPSKAAAHPSFFSIQAQVA